MTMVHSSSLLRRARVFQSRQCVVLDELEPYVALRFGTGGNRTPIVRIVGSKYEIIVQDCPSFSIFSFNVVTPAVAKNLFAPAITVNDKSITYYALVKRHFLLKAGQPRSFGTDIAEDR